MSPVPILEPLESRIRQIRDLPTLPVVVTKAMGLLNNPDCTLREVGELIATDQVLSARTLRLVGSPYYGLGRPLKSVMEAAVYLGRNGLRSLVVSSALVRSVSQAKGGQISVRFWEHAFASAICARLLACKLTPAQADDAYLAALLHDLGRLVLSCHFLAEEDQIRAEARATGRAMLELEQEAWQGTHADAGYWLGQNWRLPDTILEAVRMHHRPKEVEDGRRAFCAIVHLADEMAFEHGFGDQDAFDAVHHGLELGAEILAECTQKEFTPDSLRELVGQEILDVRQLVEMVYAA